MPLRKEIDSVGLEACLMSGWLHRHLTKGGFDAICVVTRHAQRLSSTRLVKIGHNDAHGLAKMMWVGHYRPVYVKTPKAQHVWTVLQVRRQIVACRRVRN